MEKASLYNFHVPLPVNIYSELRAEAKRARRPATALARQAIEMWLAQQRKAALHEAIAAYAARMAGGEADLDAALESASLELWQEEERQRSPRSQPGKNKRSKR